MKSIFKINHFILYNKFFLTLILIFIFSIFIKHPNILANANNEKINSSINIFFELDRKANLNNALPCFNSIIESTSLLNEINNKYEFERQWREKLEYSILSYNYTLKTTIKEIKDNIAKVYVERNLEFTMTTCPKIPQKSQNERFIFILKDIDDVWKIVDYCYEEENPDYFDTLTTDDLQDDFRNFPSTWSNKLSNIDLLLNDFNNIVNENFSLSNFSASTNSINREKIADYAEKYALLRNSLYRDFEESGGDCTNFISQALYYGGLNQTTDWKPYTYPWIRVRDLRDYLIYNGLATESSKIGENYLGGLVQFSTTNYDGWSHSAIITYKLPNNDYLYCCHSYDKLNYPLSKSYPLIYPKIRVLDLN